MSAVHDEGFVTTEWILGILVLLLPAMLMMGLLPAWAARHEAAAAAAREGARHAALTIDQGTSEASATAAVSEVLAARGLAGQGLEIIVLVPPPVSGQPAREGEVEVQVRISGPPVSLPFLGTVETPTVGAAHTRQLNPYRSQP